MLKQPTQSHCCRNCKYVILFYSKDAAKIQLFLNITTFCKNYFANHHSFTTARRRSAPWWRFRKNDSCDSSVTTLQNPVFFFLDFIAISNFSISSSTQYQSNNSPKNQKEMWGNSVFTLWKSSNNNKFKQTTENTKDCFYEVRSPFAVARGQKKKPGRNSLAFIGSLRSDCAIIQWATRYQRWFYEPKRQPLPTCEPRSRCEWWVQCWTCANGPNCQQNQSWHRL